MQVRSSLVGQVRISRPGRAWKDAPRWRDPAPVGVVDGGQRWMLPVGAGSDPPGDRRVQAVGAHDDPGPQRRSGGCPVMAPHAHCPALGPQQVADHEALDQVGARFLCGSGQQRVEHGPPRTVRVGHAVHGRPDARYLHRADVEGNLPDRRAAPAAQPLEQPPGLQPGRAALPQEMRGHGVARE